MARWTCSGLCSRLWVEADALPCQSLMPRLLPTWRGFSCFKWSWNWRRPGQGYENDFFIGTVLEVASSGVATIQFLNRGFQTVYRWPRIDDVADVRSKFVFAADIEVVLNANGCTYSVSEVDYLQQLYEEYASEYFWTFQQTIVNSVIIHSLIFRINQSLWICCRLMLNMYAVNMCHFLYICAYAIKLNILPIKQVSCLT